MSDDLVNRLREGPMSFHEARIKMDAAATALEEARAEIERLRASVTRLTANPADHRYWEGRWRDADRELSTLRARVREVVGPFAAVVLPWGDIGSGMIDANSVRAARQLMEDLK